MSFHHQAKIVTSGLEMYLDAKNPKSYPGDGSSWYDIVGTTDGSFGNTTTFQNNSMYFNADASALITCAPTTLLDTDNPYTIEFWSYLESSYAGSYPMVLYLKTSQATGFVFFYGPGGYDGLNFGSNANFTRMRANTTPFFTDDWIQHVIVYDGLDRTDASSYKCYLNSSEQTITAAASFAVVPNSTVLGGNYNASGAYFTGYIDVVKIYNAALSSDQILQNYNALKSRYT